MYNNSYTVLLKVKNKAVTEEYAQSVCVLKNAHLMHTLRIIEDSSNQNW